MPLTCASVACRRTPTTSFARLRLRTPHAASSMERDGLHRQPRLRASAYQRAWLMLRASASCCETATTLHDRTHCVTDVASVAASLTGGRTGTIWYRPYEITFRSTCAFLHPSAARALRPSVTISETWVARGLALRRAPGAPRPQALGLEAAPLSLWRPLPAPLPPAEMGRSVRVTPYDCRH
jgi:hypothetical protein